MTIKVSFKTREYANFSDILNTRLGLGLEILQHYINNYFHPEKLDSGYIHHIKNWEVK